MTFGGLTRRFRGSTRLRGRVHDPLIGAADRTFSCPACARPLPIGQGRCSGCGSYLFVGILVRTALFLILVGSVLGMIGGAMIAGVAMAPRLAVADEAQAAAAAASSAPAAQQIATPAPANGTRLPSGVAAGILQVASVNERLARSRSSLSAALAARGAGAASIAPILRKVAADVRSGEPAAGRLASWDPARALVTDVTALYRSVAAVAADGLGAPLSDNAAYVRAGRRMLTALKPLAAVDAATHALAGTAGIGLSEESPAP